MSHQAENRCPQCGVIGEEPCVDAGAVGVHFYRERDPRPTIASTLAMLVAKWERGETQSLDPLMRQGREVLERGK